MTRHAVNWFYDDETGQLLGEVQAPDGSQGITLLTREAVAEAKAEVDAAKVRAEEVRVDAAEALAEQVERATKGR